MMSSPAIKGMFRVALADDAGRIVGDSGFRDNIVTSNGIDDLFTKITGYTTSSDWVWLALGTGTVPAFSATTLDGELQVSAAPKRLDLSGGSASYGWTVAAASSTPSTLRYEGTFAASYFTASADIANVGIFYASTGNVLVCGNTFASSNMQSAQAVYVTYDITLVQP